MVLGSWRRLLGLVALLCRMSRHLVEMALLVQRVVARNAPASELEPGTDIAGSLLDAEMGSEVQLHLDPDQALCYIGKTVLALQCMGTGTAAHTRGKAVSAPSGPSKMAAFAVVVAAVLEEELPEPFAAQLGRPSRP